jgi:hypothetical protein
MRIAVFAVVLAAGNCGGARSGPIRVTPPDPFGLDSDHDGVGCKRS